MALEAATWVNDLVPANPASTDAATQGDDHLRLIKAALKATFPDASQAFYFPNVLSKSANYSAVAADDNSLILVDATAGPVTITLPDVTTVINGYRSVVKKIDASVNAVTVKDGNVTPATIDGAASVALTFQYSTLSVEGNQVKWSVVSTNAGAPSLAFSALTGLPTTLAGYGIVDAESLGKIRGINTQTVNYVAVLTDAGKVIEMNLAGANTLTIPPNSSVAFPLQTYINCSQIGAGATTITAGAGVTIRNRLGLKLGGQYAAAGLYKRGTDEWVASGDLTT
jgi:hypothetical protein